MKKIIILISFLFIVTGTIYSQNTDSVTIVNNTLSLDMEYQSGVKYSFLKNNVEIELWVRGSVLVHDASGRKVELWNDYVISPDAASPSDLLDSLNLYVNSGGFVVFSDTLTTIGTRYNEDTLAVSLYDSLGNIYTEGQIDDLLLLKLNKTDSITIYATYYGLDTLSSSAYDSLNNIYTETQVDDLLDLKLNKTDSITIYATEYGLDTLTGSLYDSLATIYTSIQVDNLLALKLNKTDSITIYATYYGLDSLSKSIYDSLGTIYTESQVDDLLDLKLNKTDSITVYATQYGLDTLTSSLYDSLGNIYTETQVDGLLDLKQDTSSFFAYTNTENIFVETQIFDTIKSTHVGGLSPLSIGEADSRLTIYSDTVVVDSIFSLGNVDDVYHTLAHVNSTGLEYGGIITHNSLDTTLIDISAGHGIITDYINHTIQVIEWTDTTYDMTTHVGVGGDVTAIFLSIKDDNNDGIIEIVERNSEPTNVQNKQTIDLGLSVRKENDTVFLIINTPQNITQSIANQFQDYIRTIGGFSASGNIIESYDGTDLKLKKSSGTTFKNGVGFRDNPLNPHIKNLQALDSIPFGYKLGDGTDISFGNYYLDPTKYDDGTSTPATVSPLSKFTIQVIGFFAEGVHEIQYGQEVFGTRDDAIDAIESGSYINNFTIPIDSRARINMYYIIMQGTATAVTAADIIPVQGGGAIGGISSTTLQESYNNSSIPQITTNGSGALQVKSGTGNNNDSLQQWLNNAGTVTAEINGNGHFYADTITYDYLEYQATRINLADGVANGASLFANTGAGFQASFDAASDDEMLYQIDLGSSYNAESFKIQYDYVLFTTAPGGTDTIQLEVDYYFFVDGEAVNPISAVDGNNVDKIDISGETADRPITYLSTTTVTGKANATTLNLTIRRNSTGTTSDNYTNSWDLYGIKLIKQ